MVTQTQETTKRPIEYVDEDSDEDQNSANQNKFIAFSDSEDESDGFQIVTNKHARKQPSTRHATGSSVENEVLSSAYAKDDDTVVTEANVIPSSGFFQVLSTSKNDDTESDSDESVKTCSQDSHMPEPLSQCDALPSQEKLAVFLENIKPYKNHVKRCRAFCPDFEKLLQALSTAAKAPTTDKPLKQRIGKLMEKLRNDLKSRGIKTSY